MKELSIEEKAKRYDESLEKAKAWCDCEHATTDDKILLKRIFHELAESEDERIRKAIIEFFKNFSKNGTWKAIPDVTKWIAWLEKQCEQTPVISDDALREGIVHFGITQYQIDNWLKKYVDVEKQSEQKPAGKVEPKFKVGQTITDPTDSTFTFHINKIEDGRYIEKEDEWVLVKEDDANYELVEEPVSEELEKAAWLYFDKNRLPIPPEWDLHKEFIDFFKAGAQWQITKLMKDATEVTVHIDAGGYPYTPEIELYDYDKDVPLAKEGDKYKVVLIKED